MKQHQINLITPDMLTRIRAGRRTRRIAGVCIALIGVPVFAVILRRIHANGGWSDD